MNTLKKYFPFSFGAADFASLVIKVIIYAILGAIVGVLLGIIGRIPVIGIIFGIIGWTVEIYTSAGIVIAVLDYFKVLK